MSAFSISIQESDRVPEASLVAAEGGGLVFVHPVTAIKLRQPDLLPRLSEILEWRLMDALRRLDWRLASMIQHIDYEADALEMVGGEGA